MIDAIKKICFIGNHLLGCDEHLLAGMQNDSEIVPRVDDVDVLDHRVAADAVAALEAALRVTLTVLLLEAGDTLLLGDHLIVDSDKGVLVLLVAELTEVTSVDLSNEAGELVRAIGRHHCWTGVVGFIIYI